jgi:HAE1 family hydrophobic/amphiphilic exporter-1
MKIADYSISHGATVIMAIAAALVFGVLALFSIPQEQLPDISTPRILILTQYPGVGPKDIEQQITKPIEDAVSSLSGITKLTSHSLDSYSTIELEFDWSTNLDLKLPTLREKVNAIIRQLPSGITGPPEFFTFSANDLPILTYVVHSSRDLDTTRYFLTDHVLPFFQRVPGVASAAIQGVPERQLRVTLDLRELANRGISPIEVLQALEANNVSLPAGSVTFHGSNLNVRSVGEFSSFEDVRDVTVGVHDTTLVRLRDIATVQIGEEKRDVYAVVNGTDSLAIDITKQPGADTIQIINRIKKAAGQIEKQEGGNLAFTATTDRSVDIRRAVQSVANSALQGAILVIVIIFLILLNVRSTIVVAISIPLSIILAVTGLYVSGKTLNVVTLAGLTVAIGMVVDDSIVVLENSYKHLERGIDPTSAASRGTAEVVGAVIASTTTALAVFVPILFVGGFVGTILRDISLAVIFALVASFLMAVFVVPYLFSRIVRLPKEASNGQQERRIPASASSRAISGLERAYSRALNWSVSNWPFVVVFALVVLILSFGALKLVGMQFVPDTDTGQIVINIDTPDGYTLQQTKDKVLSIDELIGKIGPEVVTRMFYVGQSTSLGIGGKSNNEVYGVISLVPMNRRHRSVFQIINLLQREIPQTVPDVKVTIQNGGIDYNTAQALGGSGFQIDVSGTDFGHVRDAARSLQGIIGSDPDVSAVDLNVRFDRDDLVEQYNQSDMAQMGVLPYNAALTSRIILNGMDAGTYRTPDRDYTVFLTSGVADRKISGNLLNEMSVKTQSGNFVNFSAFTALKTEPSYSEIPHVEKLKTITITAYLSKADVQGLRQRATAKIGALTLPAEVTWQITGQTQQMEQSFASLGMVLAIAVFLVYIVMVLQFQRFAQPLVIMGSIPFILIGAVASLVAFGSTLSIISFLGLITLAGTVAKNAIVLVDYMNMLRRDHKMGLKEAVLEGGRLRLRPIVMTTLATVLGVIPMAFSIGEGSSLTASLGQVIGGGLITSTLITLFLIPTLYYLLERRVEVRNAKA